MMGMSNIFVFFMFCHVIMIWPNHLTSFGLLWGHDKIFIATAVGWLVLFYGVSIHLMQNNVILVWFGFMAYQPLSVI